MANGANEHKGNPFDGYEKHMNDSTTSTLDDLIGDHKFK